jgi:hypothetical protein
MGQRDIIFVLNQYRGQRFDSSQLSQLTGRCRSAVEVALRSLRKSNDIGFEKKRNNKYYYWGIE